MTCNALIVATLLAVSWYPVREPEVAWYPRAKPAPVVYERVGSYLLPTDVVQWMRGNPGRARIRNGVVYRYVCPKESKTGRCQWLPMTDTPVIFSPLNARRR